MNTTIQHIPLFKAGTPSFFEKISSSAQHQSHKKGKILFIQGDEAQRFYYVKNGWIKLFRETLDGTQAVIDILQEGHLFGETALFENNIYPYSAEIVESAEIISFALSELKAEIETNNKMALAMLKTMAYERAQQDKEIEHRSIQNASQRIGCFLLRLADQNETGPVVVRLPYDKMLLAARLGIQPETFSRALAKLRDKTGIRIQGATIEMDSLEQISNYCCSACSSAFPCKDLQAAE